MSTQSKPKIHKIINKCKAKVPVFSPKWLEMYGQANLPSSVHLQTPQKQNISNLKQLKIRWKWVKKESSNLLGLAIELGELKLGGRGGVRNRNIKLEIEFVL